LSTVAGRTSRPPAEGSIISAERAPRRPDLRFLFAHPAHFIALGFGSGLSRVAPGTMGTLLAFPIFGFLHPRLSDGWFAILLVGLFLLGIVVSERTSRALGVHDHGGIVIDEIVACLLVLYMIPTEPGWQAFGFLLFRVFDILKPLHIRMLDRTVKGGIGIMLDDLVAAFYALLVLATWKAIV
jgi:phosphatidylglycerophosphatase A